MAEQVTTFTARLNEAMAVRGLKQADVMRMSGLSKQQMSQYARGIFVPKIPALYKLTEALDVNEVWLMGYDVPMERDKQAIREREFCIFLY